MDLRLGMVKEMKNASTFIAFLVALAFTFGWYWWQQYILAITPYSNWFYVRSIDIADVPFGTDPAVVYDREIRKEFDGEWIVEIVRTQDKFTICTGFGKNHYEPKDKIPDAGVTLSWLVGKDCKLPKGQYTAQAFWKIMPDGYPPKSLRVISNIFEVK